LARLDLTETEKATYADQLSVVFNYIEMLKEVETGEVAETCQVTGLQDIYREDKPEPRNPEEVRNLVNTFPEKVGKLLKVSAIFSEEEE
jgi:aspartyl-tRNA(Asn)/glutamyl-tRNA(Gln) amidotransferase subunit C